MSNIRVLVDFINGTEQRNFKIQVGRETTVAHLHYKLRKYMKMKPCEACYLFFQYPALIYGKNEKLYNGNKLLTEIQSELCMETLHVKMLLESTFGDLNRRFTNATISELKNGVCWILTVHYSYYNMYNYSDTFVYPTMEECIKKLCLERCDQKLIIKNKENIVVDINVL
jgi:hypothetical protein